MSTNYNQYRPDLSGLDPYDGSTGRFGGVDPKYLRTTSRIRTFFKKPRNYSKNAGLGYVLPNIGGLRLKEITTPQGKRTAIVGGPGGYTYGLAAPGAAKNLMIGRDAKGRIALVKRGARPATGPGAPGTGTPGNNTPATDEYTKYEKDYPWIATYLRGIRDEENAFNTKFKNEFQPSVSAALESFGNLGVGAADRYARAAAASVAANRAAQNVAPTEAAGATGVFDPISLAAQQASARATGDAAAENARMMATTSALAPATAAQGLLANIQRSYATISAEYARKRLDDQLKIEQWIQEQKTSAEDRAIRQQYNAALLKLRGDELALDTTKAANDAASEGQFTGAELITKGFVPVPTGAGPKSMAAVRAAGIVTATDGGQYYKPRSGGGGGGGGGGGTKSDLTGGQLQSGAKTLGEAYSGEMFEGEAVGGYVNSSPENQVAAIVAWLKRNGPGLGLNKSNLSGFLRESLSGRVSGSWRGRGSSPVEALIKEVVKRYGG